MTYSRSIESPESSAIVTSGNTGVMENLDYFDGPINFPRTRDELRINSHFDYNIQGSVQCLITDKRSVAKIYI